MTAIRPQKSPFVRWPSTEQGRRAVILWGAAVGVLVMALLVTLATGGVYQEAGEDSTPTWARALSAILGIAALGGAVIGGVYAVLALRKGDRSALLFVPLLALVLAAVFLIGEFAVPH